MKLKHIFLAAHVGKRLFRHEGGRLLMLMGGIVAADQLLKHSIDAEPAENFPREMPHTKGLLRLQRAHNTGFSMEHLRQYPEFVKLSSLGITAFLGGVLFSDCRHFPGRHRLQKAGLAIAAAGAVSNTYDRIRHGYVTDYLHIQFGRMKRAIINIADIAIHIGGVLYVLASLLPLC